MQVDAPMFDWAVQEKREGIWKEICTPAMVVAEKEAAKAKDSVTDETSRNAKPARATTADSSTEKVGAWAKLGPEQQEEYEMSPEEEMAKAVDNKLKANRDKNTPTSNL